MDKRTIDYRRQTTGDRLQLAVCGLQSAVYVFAMLALLPITGYAATQTSENAEGTSNEPSVVISRSIEAGKRVLSRALSSKTKPVAAKATPGALPVQAVKKYVFEYPEQPVIDEKMEPVKKKIEGEVGVVIKMGMNVEFDRNNKAATSSDLWINFSKGIKLEGVKAFGDFRDGDKVQVAYTETKDGSKRVIDSIKLLKAKTDEERKKEALEAEAAALAETKAAKSVSLEEES